MSIIKLPMAQQYKYAIADTGAKPGESNKMLIGTVAKKQPPVGSQNSSDSFLK